MPINPPYLLSPVSSSIKGSEALPEFHQHAILRDITGSSLTVCCKLLANTLWNFAGHWQVKDNQEIASFWFSDILDFSIHKL